MNDPNDGWILTPQMFSIGVITLMAVLTMGGALIDLLFASARRRLKP